jgi:hypothetical protein
MYFRNGLRAPSTTVRSEQAAAWDWARTECGRSVSGELEGDAHFDRGEVLGYRREGGGAIERGKRCP